MTEKNLKFHVTILGWVNVVVGLLFVCLGLLALLFFTGMGALAHDEPEALPILGFLGVFVSVYMSAMGLPSLVAGYALLTRKSWGRILGLVVGCLNMFNVPIGTLLGIYTLWVLLNDQAAAYFSRTPPAEATAVR